MLVADDEDLFREGLSVLFARDPEIRIVGQASTGAEACEKVRRLEPDIVLLALHLPDMTGVDVARTISKDVPATRVALISKRFSRADLVDAISVGVRGYITKDVELSTLIQAVKVVARGEFFVPPESSGVLLAELVAISESNHREHFAAAADRAKVTDRECDVLQLLVQGATNRDIAGRLHITENTVKVHLRNILDKLQLRNRQQAAAFAVSSGLVTLQREDSAPRRPSNGAHRRPYAGAGRGS